MNKMNHNPLPPLPDYSDADTARALASAFLDGRTSAADEEWLYNYYRNNTPGTLPAELEQMRAMFGWYATLGERLAPARPRRSRRTLWIALAAACAMIAVLIPGLVMLTGRTETTGGSGTFSSGYVMRGHDLSGSETIIYADTVSVDTTYSSSGR